MFADQIPGGGGGGIIKHHLFPSGYVSSSQEMLDYIDQSPLDL